MRQIVSKPLEHSDFIFVSVPTTEEIESSQLVALQRVGKHAGRVFTDIAFMLTKQYSAAFWFLQCRDATVVDKLMHLEYEKVVSGVMPSFSRGDLVDLYTERKYVNGLNPCLCIGCKKIIEFE
jgi:hypothetical protein